jgi:hypothetical protein
MKHLRGSGSHGHWFELEADQTYLPPLISELDSVLERFPVRG